MSIIRFSHPQYLLLLPLVWAFTWWVLRDSLADLTRSRRKLAVILRALLFTLVVLALAGLQWVRPTHSLCTVFAVDVSDSIAPGQRAVILDYIRKATRHMRKDDRAALVAFGAEALLDHAPEEKAAIRNVYALPTTSRTNIAAAIQLAMASFPQESGKQIVLFTDGNENLGSALEQADLASSTDVRISVVPIGRDTRKGEALLLHTDAPVTVKEGAPFRVSVVAEALQETAGTVTLWRDGTAVERRPVQLPVGKTVLTFEQIVPTGGLYQFKAVLDVPADHDTVPDNNVAYAYTRVAGKPRVLIVSEQPMDRQYLARALQAHDLTVESGGPDRLPASLAACAQYDSLVLANVPAWRMSPAQMQIIRSAVRDTGMGLAMVGGEQSFGAGGYWHTPIEEALPVTMDMKKQKKLPSLTLVIVIDISGSMGAMENGVQKIDLAAEAAAAAVELMQPIDQVCVIGYDTPDAFTYTVKLTKVNNKQLIISQIKTLRPGGGGIYGYSALLEAYKVIKDAKTQIRHILFCADAADDDEPGDSINLARRMLREKITLSTIGFGRAQDKDWPLYQQMAKAGGGTSYLTERLSNLPQIFTRDLMFTAKSLIVEENFQVRSRIANHPVAQHIPWEASPPLQGYVTTSMKETPSALEILSSHQQDPILAAWPYGLGRSIAFTSDATAHWGAHWLGWDRFSPYWAQALRWTLRQSGAANFQTTVTEDHGRATIAVEAITPQGEFRNLLDLRAHVSHVSVSSLHGPRTTNEELKLEQTAPGHYEANFETRLAGTHGAETYVVTVEERQRNKTKGLQTATLVIPYSPEYQTVHSDKALLADLTEHARGAINPLPADVFGRLRFGSRTLHDIWPFLLTLAAVLFLFDVAVRRILLPWDECFAAASKFVMKPMAKVKATRLRRAHTPQRTEALDGLFTAKARSQRSPEGLTTERLRSLREQAREEHRHPTPIIAEDTAPADDPTPTAAAAQPSTVGALLSKKRERHEK